MRNINLARWVVGRITEPWQRRVVERNRQLAIDTINGLTMIVYGGVAPGCGAADFEAQCDELAKLSGEEIAGQLRRFWKVT